MVSILFSMEQYSLRPTPRYLLAKDYIYAGADWHLFSVGVIMALKRPVGCGQALNGCGHLENFS